MSDTPRTDEFAAGFEPFGTGAHPEWIEFARQLERENAELREENARLASQVRRLYEETGVLKKAKP